MNESRKNAKKRMPPAVFDVEDFLRPTDTDLRSALNSLLGSAEGVGTTTPRPAPELSPDPKLRSDIKLIPDPNSIAASNLGPAADLPGQPLIEVVSVYPSKPIAPSQIRQASKLEPPIKLKPAPSLEVGSSSSSKKRQFAVRCAVSVSDGHSRAEQTLYETMWKEGAALDDRSRTLTIGFLTLGRLAGLSESNARINLRSLIRKLAVEQYSGYVCEQSTGYTWRVFSPESVLQRRSAAGLIWYTKRTLAVVFVDPEDQDRRLT